jgi:transaldolase / glucose-6-phosphate isomerase
MEDYMNALRALAQHGQSVWLDFLSRDFLDQGGLARLVRDDAVSGVTSNPSIFEKAIGESGQYDAEIERVTGEGAFAVNAAYERIAVADIRRAADILRPIYEATAARDGFVSLEVSPHLAMDIVGTIAEAHRLWTTVGRANVMIKVPGTAPGLAAIRQLLSEGININITLVFSQQVYKQVVDAYLSALEHRRAHGLALDHMASVASFFISRIDSVADKELNARIAQIADDALRSALTELRGKVAIANAKLAYQHYLESFSGPRWEQLVARGARPQRLLWASTGTKNPTYSDVLYVEELIGPDTVNTMPQKTMDAFRDHGRVSQTLTNGVEQAREVLARLDRASISLDHITADLLIDGVRLFSDAFDQLLGTLADKRRRILGSNMNAARCSLDSAEQAEVDELAQVWRRRGDVRRLWNRDPSLWTGGDEAQWLGWLDIIEQELQNCGELLDFQNEVRQQGFRDALLLGTGGASLAPDVISRTLRSADSFPRLKVLDSVDPMQIRASEQDLDLRRTLFIVSSQSGSTLEPNILMDYFFNRAVEEMGETSASEAFIAITDAGSPLEAIAKQRGYRKVFHGSPGIGGRYSVLSRFGLVPLAAIGGDAKAFLKSALVMVRACGSEVPPAQNPGVMLGLVLGALARRGRDKVTFVASPSVSEFGAWAEQLLAESTGRHGQGLIPITQEPMAPPGAYGSDRLVIYLRDTSAPDPAQDRAVDALELAGQPIVRIALAGARLIGQEFFRWQIAVAVAGAVIGTNPFEEPVVDGSKLAIHELSEASEWAESPLAETPLFAGDGIALFADEVNARALKDAGASTTLESWLRAHFTRIRPGDYLALLAYVNRSEPHIKVLQDLRAGVLTHKHVATCLGFGPRFLHATGPACKGGPNTGVFLQITADPGVDLEIPARHVSFASVEAAQARGHFRVLCKYGRRLLRVHLAYNVSAGLEALSQAAKRALS